MDNITAGVPDTQIDLSTIRHDGWTNARAVTFLQTLQATASVTRAAKAAGMSREACYALRRRERHFAAAWTAAVTCATQVLADDALERAIEGETVPSYYKGEIVGERTRYDNRLTMFLLRAHDPKRYGRHADVLGYGEPDPMLTADKALRTNTAVVE